MKVLFKMKTNLRPYFNLCVSCMVGIVCFMTVFLMLVIFEFLIEIIGL